MPRRRARCVVAFATIVSRCSPPRRRRCSATSAMPSSATRARRRSSHARRQVLRAHRRARRQARRLRDPYTFGVEPLQQYLIELPGGRLQALGIAWDARPKEQGGQRWFHLYPGAEPARRRPAALDRRQSELELHVRRVPLDRAAQELRRGDAALRDHVGGDQRRLRSLPRARRRSRRVGGGQARRQAVSGTRQRARDRARRAQGRHVDAGGRDRQRAAQRAADDVARDRHVRALPRARRAHLRRFRPRQAAVRTRAGSRTSTRASTSPTARSATRSTNGARSCRAGCRRKGVTCARLP